jgi:sporulation protein YlmC with PRC-barrel domain
MDDLGSPSSYLTIEPGVAVYSRDGEALGEVQNVLADTDEDVFDGIVIDVSALPGGLRFADAAQVAEIYERGVVLAVDAAGAEALPEPSDNPGVLEVDGLEDVDRSEFRERLRRAWELVSGRGNSER